ncbi:WD40 repeat-like protein [Gloeopeniophorella convolvens]|nr:WD40 repeat-like protein [Gloeopeniophorella convolvens]
MSSAHPRRTSAPNRSLYPTAHHRTRQNIVSGLFDGGFPYSRKLTGHSSCVNALAFSPGSGRWLASAGDDRVVKLWDLHQEDVATPSCSFSGPHSNVFTVAFSASNQYIFSGGADDTVLKYDMTRYTSHFTTENEPMQAYTQHSDFIRSVSCHPHQDEIFMTASEDGCVMLHDGRAESRMTRAQGTLRQAAEFSGATFHPTIEHLFATSDVRGNVRLRDMRMAFGPLSQRTNEGIVLKYVTRITKRSAVHYIRPEASSITWDPDGESYRYFQRTFHWFPTVYSLNDPYPIAVCSGRNLPDGSPSPPDERTFADSTTMKHGSFGGSALTTGGETYYSSGSDDFRGYLWKVPSLEALGDERQEIAADEWLNGGEDGIIAFTGPSYSSKKYVPKELSTPLTRLGGHLSIVNTTLIHPVLPLIATSGIERHVILHSPTPSAPFAVDLSPTSATARSLPSTASALGEPAVLRLLMDIGTITDPDDSMGEDARSIAYFDMILQREGGRDLFALRRPAMQSDDDADYDDMVMDDGSEHVIPEGL